MKCQRSQCIIYIANGSIDSTRAQIVCLSYNSVLVVLSFLQEHLNCALVFLLLPAKTYDWTTVLY